MQANDANPNHLEGLIVAASVNDVTFIGRLTRDPEIKAFQNGGKVAKWGFAVSNRKKNSQTGQWEDVPMFIDCETYNRGEFSKRADLVERYLRKGSLCYLKGRIELDQWDDKTTGQKRSKHKLVVDAIQFLDRLDEHSQRTPEHEDSQVNDAAPIGDDEAPW